MTKKELAELYVETLITIEEKEDLISEAIKQVNPDNYIVSLVPQSFYNLLETMALEVLGEGVLDWITWWVYESSRGTEEIIVAANGVIVTGSISKKVITAASLITKTCITTYKIVCSAKGIITAGTFSAKIIAFSVSSDFTCIFDDKGVMASSGS